MAKSKFNKKRRYGIYDPIQKAFFSFYINDNGGITYDKYGYEDRNDLIKNVISKNTPVKFQRSSESLSSIFSLNEKDFFVKDEIISKRNSKRKLQSILYDIDSNIADQKKLKKEFKNYNRLTKKQKKELTTEYLDSHLSIETIEKKFKTLSKKREHKDRQTGNFQRFAKTLISHETGQSFKAEMTYGNKSSPIVFIGTSLYKYLVRWLKNIKKKGLEYNRFQIYVYAPDKDDNFNGQLNRSDFKTQDILENALATIVKNFGHIELQKRNVQIELRELL